MDRLTLSTIYKNLVLELEHLTLWYVWTQDARTMKLFGLLLH